MTGAPWPCSTCGLGGVRNIGTKGYCSTHLGELFATFDPIVFAQGGVGLQCGPLDPDVGPHAALLRCCRCGATWTGDPGEWCWWCQRLIEGMRAHQAELLMTPPDVDPADVGRDAALEAWARRLAIGVKAGIVTERAARAALNKEIAA
jgi:hypothetical protein